MKDILFTGSGVAIVTPFTENNSAINFPVLEKLINFQIESGTDAIIICGTTGEGSTLSHEEHAEAIRFAVDTVNKRVPVISGTGSNDTMYGLKLSNEAEKAGVDGLLMVTPYYNKTSQDGLIGHYNYIADRVSTPIIVYNVPSRTGLDIKPETYFELAKHKRIVGIKEANGDFSAMVKTAALCKDNITVYSGNDDHILGFMAHGAKGVISVLANVLPQVAHEIPSAYLRGDVEKAKQLQLEYLDMCNDLFVDVNPVPVKYALNLMGKNVGECRMPLGKMSDAAKAKLQATMKRHNLI
ncbi:MAG: 4-hydroxy-tetrahydrodipicolinate synthase [Oscillospiraceae bacterium]|nr:4-hydroxy-tetrahydrodipicolinate synthase [Oscillospiraceae bacterium]